MGLKIGNVWKLLKMGKLRGFWCVYYITLLHTMQTSYIYIDIYSFSNQPTSFLMLQRRWIRQWLRHLPCLEIFQLKVYYYHQVVSLNLCHQSLTKGRWEIKYEEFLSALHISYTIISQTLHCMVYLHTICKFTPQLPKCRSVDQPQWASSYAMPTFFNHCNFLVGGKERSTESTSFNSHLLRKLCKNDENFSDIFESLGNTNFLWNKAFFRWYKFFSMIFFADSEIPDSFQILRSEWRSPFPPEFWPPTKSRMSFFSMRHMINMTPQHERWLSPLVWTKMQINNSHWLNSSRWMTSLKKISLSICLVLCTPPACEPQNLQKNGSASSNYTDSLMYSHPIHPFTRITSLVFLLNLIDGGIHLLSTTCLPPLICCELWCQLSIELKSCCFQPIWEAWNGKQENLNVLRVKNKECERNRQQLIPIKQTRIWLNIEHLSHETNLYLFHYYWWITKKTWAFFLNNPYNIL